MTNYNKRGIGLLITGFGIILLLIGVTLSFYETMRLFTSDWYWVAKTPLLFRYPYQFVGLVLILAGIILSIIGIYLWQTESKKEIWRAYAINKKSIALAILILALFLGWLIIETTEASIDYWMEKRDAFTKGSNSITLYCKNVGESDGDFKLKIEFFSPSSSRQTELPYAEVNNSTIIEVRFFLHKGESKQETIFFIIPENVTHFNIKLDCVKISPLLKSNPKFPTELMYSYNGHYNEFWRVVRG